MREIYAHYCDSENKKEPMVARFLSIYIEEAHARDEWWLWDAPESHDGGKRCIYSHKTLTDRLQTATKMQKDIDFPGTIVCDTMRGEVDDRYGAWPERLYIIEDGTIVYKGGEGPFGYKLAEVQDWLFQRFGARGNPITRR